MKVVAPNTDQLDAARSVLGKSYDAYETRHLYIATGVTQAETPLFAVPERGLRIPFVFSGTPRPGEVPPRFNVIQHLRKAIAGGSTFVLVVGK